MMVSFSFCSHYYLLSNLISCVVFISHGVCRSSSEDFDSSSGESPYIEYESDSADYSESSSVDELEPSSSYASESSSEDEYESSSADENDSSDASEDKDESIIAAEMAQE